MDFSKVGLYYLIAVNVITFALYGIDKWKAVHDKWRIREAVLIGMALIGGGLGAVLGMRLFHHKTQKPLFVIGVPLCIVIDIAAVIFVMWKF